MSEEKPKKPPKDVSGHEWTEFVHWLACKNCGEIKVPDGVNEECPKQGKIKEKR